MQQLPAALTTRRQFIVYMTVPSRTRPGKTDKFPLDSRSGAVANAHDPAIWLSADEALATGWPVGFVFTDDDPFWFLDIDGCLEPSGQWSPLALQLLAAFPGAAVEVSQSGQGLHIFGSGPVPPHACKNTELGLELYHTGRFVALTGTHLQGDANTQHPAALQWLVSTYFAPGTVTDSSDWRDGPVPEWSGPTDDDELIARMLRHQSAAGAFGGRASFRDLWECNADALGRSFPDPQRPYDASSADAALAAHLAYYTGNDHERMLRLMRRSALAREKWEREEYIRGTITYSASRTSRWLADRPASTAVAAAAAAGGSFLAAAAGAIPATLVNVQAALRSPEGGVRLAYDAFKDRIVLSDGEQWQPFSDVDYVKLRTAFEERGFKPVSGDLMRDAVLGVAMANTIDTAQMWADSLVWDGVPRVDSAMVEYFGSEANPYTEAVGRYLFTALAGRALEPGCQADMALILVGAEGLRKTSTVAALAPIPDAFAEINLEKLDDDNSRKMRGKLVCELAELRGLKGRDSESIRAWVTRRHETWTPKYREFETTFARRCVLIGTSNPREILSDPEGHRRWLPVDVTQANDEALARDRAQLWAEGVALWRRHGVMWEEAQHLAKREHHKFEEQDLWSEVIESWLAKPPTAGPGEVPSPIPRGDGRFALVDLLRGALALDASRQGTREEKRAVKVLRKLGFTKGPVWENGKSVQRWFREVQGTPQGARA